MDSKTTLVVTATPDPNEMPAAQQYLQDVVPLLARAGGRLIKRVEVVRVISGRPSAMVVVMEFDSARAITEVFKSNAYAALVPARDLGFREMNILLADDL